MKKKLYFLSAGSEEAKWEGIMLLVYILLFKILLHKE